MTKKELSQRIIELSKIEAGWLDGNGQQADMELLEWIERHIPEDKEFIENLLIFPYMESGYNLEWYFENKNITSKEIKNNFIELTLFSLHRFSFNPNGQEIHGQLTICLDDKIILEKKDFFDEKIFMEILTYIKKFNKMI